MKVNTADIKNLAFRDVAHTGRIMKTISKLYEKTFGIQKSYLQL